MATANCMELRYLKSFVVAAKLLNYSEAAREMCVTQSTFSQTIKQLEEELGTVLFYRTSHKVSLTKAGEELLPFAVTAIDSADNCLRRMNDMQALKCGTLNIGVTHSFNMVMHETLKDFMKLYPDIFLNIVYKPMTELINRLMNHELDFVLSFRPQGNYPLIESHLLFDDVLSVIVRRDSPLAAYDKISLSVLTEYPAVLPAKGLQARNTLDDILSETGTELNVRAEMDEVTPLLRLVRSTGMYTILSSSATEDADDLVAIPINHEGCRMEGCVQMLKGIYKNSASKEFIRILCETSLVKKRITDWLK